MCWHAHVLHQYHGFCWSLSSRWYQCHLRTTRNGFPIHVHSTDNQTADTHGLVRPISVECQLFRMHTMKQRSSCFCRSSKINDRFLIVVRSKFLYELVHNKSTIYPGASEVLLDKHHPSVVSIIWPLSGNSKSN